MKGLRIKHLRENMGLTQPQLAEKLKISSSAIAMYETDKREPSDEIKLKMCEFFNCSMDYLTGKSDFKTYQEEIHSIAVDVGNKYKKPFLELGLDKEDIDKLLSLNPSLLLNKKSENNTLDIFDYISKKYSPKIKHDCIFILEKLFLEEETILSNEYIKQLEENTIKNINILQKFYMCPVYGRISAGIPNWAEECIEGRIPIDPTLFNIIDPEEHFFLRVNGESMNKLIRNGAFALIHKQDIVENGDIAVVLVNGDEATLKKFNKQGDLIVLEPMSNDPSFNVQVYDKKTPIKILGKYIGKFEMK